MKRARWSHRPTRRSPTNDLNPGDNAQPHAITLPWTLPQGSYRVIAALYDPGQDGAPRIVTQDGADFVTLGTVTMP